METRNYLQEMKDLFERIYNKHDGALEYKQEIFLYVDKAKYEVIVRTRDLLVEWKAFPWDMSAPEINIDLLNDVTPSDNILRTAIYVEIVKKLKILEAFIDNLTRK